MSGIFGGRGVAPNLRGQATNVMTLQSGAAVQIPAGRWSVDPGRYSAIQEYDPISTLWRSVGAMGWGQHLVNSDGNNFRVANQTGCAVGATITNAGTLYTSAPTVTASSGSSTWLAVVGGAVNTSVTVVSGGSGYTYAPIVQFAAPASGGVQAAGYATISAGVVTGITVSQQGAGYSAAPIITVIPDFRDPAPNNTSCSATCVLTGSGTITAVLCTNHGTGSLSAVPTLAFSGGGGSAAAATVAMCWTVVAYAVTGGGTVYVAPVDVSSSGGVLNATAIYANTNVENGLVRVRRAQITAALSAGAITATAQVVVDGGVFSAAPLPNILTATAPSSVATLTFTMGGATDTVSIYPS